MNLRLQAINCYLESVGREKWRLPFVRVQQKAFLENVISEADYEYFKTRLKEDDELFWYFVVRFLAATGARISELLQLKAEHIRLGYLDLYTKGGKLRRIYIPQALQQEAGKWLAGQKMTSGFVFLNRQGQRITARGVSAQLKKLAVRYGIDPDVVYPPLLSPPVCQELFGPLRGHRLSGRPDGSREHRDHPHLSAQDGHGAAGHCGPGGRLVRKSAIFLPMRIFFNFVHIRQIIGPSSTIL